MLHERTAAGHRGGYRPARCRLRLCLATLYLPDAPVLRDCGGARRRRYAARVGGFHRGL